MAGSSRENRELEKFHVPVGRVETVWHLVETDIAVALSYARDGWEPGHVLAELLSAEAFLTIGFDGDDYAGCVVSRIREAPLGPVVYIWLAGGENLLAETDWFLDEARKIGAAAVEFTSPRKGFKRLKPFEAVATVYRVDI